MAQAMHLRKRSRKGQTKTKRNKLIFGGCCGESSELAADAPALVATAVEAPAAQGDVALALLPDVIWHL